MKIPLEWEEVNPSKSDNHVKTPLSHATENEYKGMVKILLE